MYEVIYLPIKPLSINSTNCVSRSGRLIKTAQANEWNISAFEALNSDENQEAINKLKKYFDYKKHQYSIKIIAHFPRSHFYKKDGTLSSKSMDVSNFEKAVIDVLFLPKHCNRPAPFGVNNLEVDDKYITKCIGEKRATDHEHHFIKIILGIKDLDPK